MKNIPKKRFPEFVNDGEWEKEKLSDIYSFKVTNSFSRDKLNYDNGLVKNIHYGDIHTKFSTSFDIEKEKVPFINSSIPLENIKNENYCQVSDMIFADASEDLEDVGKSIEIVNLNNEKLLSGLHTLLARQKEDKFITGFGGYLFKSNKIREQIKKESQGTKVLSISGTRLSNIDISYPKKKDEQQKIADCLSSLDSLILAQSQKVELLNKHKKGLLQNLFPQKGKSRPRLRFPEFENDGEWKEKKISNICNKPYSGGTPSSTNKKFYGGNIPFIRSAEIDKEQTGLFLTDEGLKNSSAKLVKKGDVLVALYGANSGDVAISKIDGAINQAILCLNSKDSNSFLYQYLVLKKDWIVIKYIQGGQGNLSGEIIKSIELKFPNPSEQQKIADCLTSLDEQISQQISKLETLKKHKKGLLQNLFPNVNEK